MDNIAFRRYFIWSWSLACQFNRNFSMSFLVECEGASFLDIRSFATMRSKAYTMSDSCRQTLFLFRLKLHAISTEHELILSSAKVLYFRQILHHNGKFPKEIMSCGWCCIAAFNSKWNNLFNRHTIKKYGVRRINNYMIHASFFGWYGHILFVL